MCLAVPLQIISINDDMAKAGLVGLVKEISLALLPEVTVGDWVLVHAGFAIHRIEETDAEETLNLLRELGEVNESNHG